MIHNVTPMLNSASIIGESENDSSRRFLPPRINHKNRERESIINFLQRSLKEESSVEPR